MDRNYYYQKHAQDHQSEILRDLATHHLLNGGKHDPLSRKQARRLVLRISFAMIAFSSLALYLAR